jgi:peptide deformylase
MTQVVPLAVIALRRYSALVILEIVKCGHPILREKGRRIDCVTPELRQLVTDMIETMRVANGIGLAAQQVGRALMLAVIDATASELPSELLVNGQPQDLAAWMPLALVNPVLSNPEGEQIGSEGCLSVPDVTADIRRAARITVRAQNLDEKEITFDCTGLLARAAQHEVDHLNGILFIDRMDAATRASFAGKIKKLQKETQAKLGKAAKPRRRMASNLVSRLALR